MTQQCISGKTALYRRVRVLCIVPKMTVPNSGLHGTISPDTLQEALVPSMGSVFFCVLVKNLS